MLGQGSTRLLGSFSAMGREESKGSRGRAVGRACGVAGMVQMGAGRWGAGRGASCVAPGRGAAQVDGSTLPRSCAVRCACRASWMSGLPDAHGKSEEGCIVTKKALAHRYAEQLELALDTWAARRRRLGSAKHVLHAP